MAEILIRVADQVSFDPIADAKLTKAGHVIVVNPDGWPWSQLERTLDFWRIVALPGVDVDAVAHLVMTESAVRRQANRRDAGADERTNPVLQARGFGIDIDNLPTAARALLMAPRTGDGIVNLWPGHVMFSIKRLAARRSPLVIGR